MPECRLFCLGLLWKVWQDILLLLCMADGLVTPLSPPPPPLGTASRSARSDARNAHCSSWQASVAAKLSITKNIICEMLSTVVASKHERVKVTEFEPIQGPQTKWQGSLDRGGGQSAFNPPNRHQIWPEKAFRTTRESSKKGEEIQLPSSAVIKSKNGDYTMVPLALLACYFPHFPGVCSAAFTCTFSTHIHLFLLSSLLSFSCRST